MPRIFVTGATGFVGRHLCRALVEQGREVTAAVRQMPSSGVLPPQVVCRQVGEIGPQTSWNGDLWTGIDTVVHLAARAHVLNERAADPAAEFRRINVEGTVALARAAAGRARRFVFVSSVGAMCTTSPQVLDETAPCCPDTPYGQSKWAAEQALARIRDETGLEVVVLRPTIMYGPENPGNLLRLIRLIRRGWPLPLGNVRNRRSLLYVQNLVAALEACIERPAAAGQTFLVSDGEDVSISELIERLAAAMGCRVRMWPAPQRLMRLAARLTGTTGTVDRLLGSLAVDITHICRTLDWRPPHTMADGLQATAQWIGSQA